jgi:hypothetical protein
MNSSSSISTDGPSCAASSGSTAGVTSTDLHPTRWEAKIFAARSGPEPPVPAGTGVLAGVLPIKAHNDVMPGEVSCI